MARNYKKKALYEVIGEAWQKPPGYGRTLEQLHPAKEPAVRMPERPAGWPRRPRIVQLNNDRIELSIPYQLAIALLLGTILLVLVTFRLGQITYPSKQRAADSAIKMSKSPQKLAPLTTAGTAQKASSEVPASAEKVEPARAKGNNRIVIQTYHLRADLELVRQYFARFGIETEIRKIGDMYYLVTRDRYQNPQRQATDGYLARQKIIKLGAKYKAPPGQETFGSRPFHDAFGKRFDD